MPTVEELKDIARKAGVRGYSKLRKDGLLSLLRELALLPIEAVDTVVDAVIPVQEYVEPTPEEQVFGDAQQEMLMTVARMDETGDVHERLMVTHKQYRDFMTKYPNIEKSMPQMDMFTKQQLKRKARERKYNAMVEKLLMETYGQRVVEPMTTDQRRSWMRWLRERQLLGIEKTIDYEFWSRAQIKEAYKQLATIDRDVLSGMMSDANSSQWTDLEDKVPGLTEWLKLSKSVADPLVMGWLIGFGKYQRLSIRNSVVQRARFPLSKDLDDEEERRVNRWQARLRSALRATTTDEYDRDSILEYYSGRFSDNLTPAQIQSVVDERPYRRSAPFEFGRQVSSAITGAVDRVVDAVVSPAAPTASSTMVVFDRETPPHYVDDDAFESGRAVKVIAVTYDEAHHLSIRPFEKADELDLFDRSWSYIYPVPPSVGEEFDENDADDEAAVWIQPEQNSHTPATLAWAKEVADKIGSNIYVLWWRVDSLDEGIFIYIDE